MHFRLLASAALGLPLFIGGCAHTPGESAWQPLFNGHDLTGWVQRGGQAKFSVADGAIVGTSVPNTGNSFLCTERTYRDFVLELEVLQNPQINSGIQFRSLCFDEPKTYRDGDKVIKVPAGRVHGYQCELDPTPRKWTGGIYEEGRRNWLVPLTGRTEAQAAYRLGEWNRIRIECEGDRLRTFVNDVPCAELVDNWTREGFFGLQVHGVGDRTEPMEIRWRNLRVRELPPAEEKRVRHERPPNIIFILADDLGWGDLGCYGQEKIRTPNIDRLATEGMRFTQHYSGNAVCAPSRCVLMTGKHPGHAFVRDNREVQPEGQFPIPDEEVTMLEWFQQAGYVTGAFGKWGLGGPGTAGEPLRQGVNRFFGYNCQRVAHNLYPNYLWDDDRRLLLNNPPFAAHQKLPAGVDARDPASYAGFKGNDYAPDRYGDAALEFIRVNQRRPFFLYFPTIVPHLALQVPDDSLAEYLGRWDDPPYPGDKSYLPHFAPRAAYAAMVTRMDRDVGRMVRLVDELGLTDTTIIVFTSDNGPTYDRLGGSDSEFFESAGPFRGLKGSLYEGGVRVPCVVRWPGRVTAGSVSDRVTGFEDWLPTLLELAGAATKPLPGIDGISFASTLLGEAQPGRTFLYREFPGYGGQQFVRMGRWKGIRQGLKPPGDQAPNRQLALYDLSTDVGERRDVALQFADVVTQIEAVMKREHGNSREFPMAAIDR